MEKNDFLRGWKEIEAYVGLRRETLFRLGYPIRREKGGKTVFAVKDELLAHAVSMPLAKKRNLQITANKPYTTHCPKSAMLFPKSGGQHGGAAIHFLFSFQS